LDFAPTETEALVEKTARDFAARVLAPRAAGRDREGLFPAEELRALGGLGLLGMGVPEAYGGAEVGAVAQARAIAALAEADAAVAVTVAVTNMVAEVIARFAAEPLCRAILPRLCAGEALSGSFALSEAQSGSDAGAMATTATPAVQEGIPGYRLRGEKLWITSGDRSGVFVVMARHPEAGGKPGRRISAFVLEAGAPGLSAGRPERKMGQHGSTTVPLALDDVFVPATARLGGEGEGLKVALAALDGGRINVGAQAVGIARAALAAAISYAKERRQFDRPIAEFQAVQLHLADMATGIEAAWLLVLAAAQAKLTGSPLTRLAAQAKLFATERAVDVCDRAIQIHGGYGYTRDYPVERHFRDVRVTTIYEGTNQIQRIVIAKQLLKEAGHG
jgi:hypothetical protein